MGNVLAILKRDLIRMLRVPAAWVIAFGLVFIPPLYAWFNIVGFWNPYGNTQGIQVVIANNDKGTTNALIGKANLGDQIVAQLKANHQLGWTFADETEAMNRVESGQAYAAIVIPKDFSDRLAGVVTGGDRPELRYYVNEKASAIAPKITDVGASTVDNQVNGTFVSTVSKTLSDAVNKATDQAGLTAGSIQTKTLKSLENAERDITKTRASIAKLSAKLDETPDKTKQARTALDDVKRLGTDASDGLTSVSDIIGGTQTTLNGFVTNTSGALDTGSTLLSQTSQQTTDSIGKVTGGLAAANGAADDAVTTLTAVNTANKKVIDQLNGIIGQLPSTNGVEALQKIVDRLDKQNANTAQTLADAKTLTKDTANTITSVNGLATNFNNATQTTLGATGDARTALTTGALPKLNASLGSLAGTAGTLGGGLTAQSTLIDQTGTVLDQLDKAAADTRKALADTDKALERTADKIATVRTDIEALDTSSMLSGLFGEDGKLDTERIAKFMLSPTVLDTQILYPVNSYGSGMAPLFTNMALWVGAFALAVILKLETDDEGIENMTITQGYMGRFLLYAILALAQGFVTTVGNLVIGVQTVNAFMYILTGMITSFVYASLVYALSTTFLHVGKGICVALIILQIPGASGLYPIEMMPNFFRNLYPFFPFTYSIDAFREAIGGFYDGHWLNKIGHLLLFVIASFALGLLIRPLMANVNRLFAREIEESDIIIGEQVHMPGTEYRVSAALRVLSDHEDYREGLERRAAQFAVHYPRLKRGALVAGLVVPVILAVTFSLTPNTKLEAMLAWLIWILIIIAFLITIEYMHDSLRRQRELGNLDDDAIRAYIQRRERAKARARARKRERVREKLANPLAPAAAPSHAAHTKAGTTGTDQAVTQRMAPITPGDIDFTDIIDPTHDAHDAHEGRRAQ
ncbi:YhgE/Pip domain-containing protein [Bifidobacterium sp. CP2]|uniref:YhgE/Pip domain-containing protein n=1 Tax=Bifidobacterium sp. CP2 TaxID=2809025 RepID=UPI001BDBD434|nr:YhgE/Pip domain-containing protein [Bifidobacterium sp. CP2]MBT1181379.1 YhgE/Pip domain-containing protein [Bifidobacterium sp. CP2]